MASKALQIRNAIITLLQTPAITGIGAGGVSVDPDYAFEAIDLPAVAVYLGDETAADRALIGALDRTLTVTARIISSGSDAFTTGDAVLATAHARIVSDLTLGGLSLDIRHTGTRRSRDVLEKPVAIAELDYSVDYRTTTASLEA
jgi:hypothetical protein